MGNASSAFDAEKPSAELDALLPGAAINEASSSSRDSSPANGSRESSEESDQETTSRTTPESRSAAAHESHIRNPEITPATATLSREITPIKLPPETPRPFPLSPPRPSQVLESPKNSSPLSSVSSNESDSEFSLPRVEDMLAMTQPKYRPSPQESRASSDRDMDLNPDPTPMPIFSKREISSSPKIPKAPSNFKPRRRKSTGTTLIPPEKEIITISSDSESEQPKSNSVTSNLKRRQLSEPSVSRTQTRFASPSASTSAVKLPDADVSYRPRKKQRRAKADSHQKHAVHWHLDGSVLVQIGKTRFRLHRSALARQSEWFRHTFERGNEAPERALNLVDNLPLYHLDDLDVDAEDFAILLDTIESAIDYVDTQPSFPTITAILRASSSLTFTKFEIYASKRFEVMWSPNLEDLTPEPIPHATESILLAHRCGLFSVRKRALYELMRHETFEAMDPAPGGTGITKQDLMRLVCARTHLTRVWNAAMGLKNIPLCTAQLEPPQQCVGMNYALSLVAHTETVESTGIALQFQYDPVCGLRALTEVPWGTHRFCEACVKARKQVWMAERERIWGELDRWLEL
ncbi:hypothetical protein H0H81_000306 [Sphagnurus paluster]|uniref:BTB domain-containing protein n=1 Tax=Sphagnurus paluster TaxID=117069 RepID=A0A9P7FT82_9AGAR|nr:hypothetical protein H0H81_000306 [Sphagnurus paluster]